MFRQIRVVMSLAADNMLGGIRGLVSSFSNLGNIITGLRNGFDMLRGAAQWLWDSFVEGALSDERLARQFGILAKNAEQGTEVLRRVEQWAIDAGVAMDEATSAAASLAPAIAAADGELNPDKLLTYMNITERLALATGKSMSEIAYSVQRAIGGDVQTLVRALRIPEEILAKMSPEFRKFLESAQGVGEQTLGQVTRIGGDTATQTGDALKLLDELANALGATQQVLDDYSESNEASITELQNRLGELKDEIGAALLPTIVQLAEEVNNFLKENPDFIPNLIDKLKEFSADEFVKLSGTLQSVEWEKIIEAVNAIAKLITGDWDVPIPGTDTPTGRALEQLFNPETGTIGGPSGEGFSPQSVGESAGALASPLFDWLNQLANNMGGGKMGLDITVSVDEEGQLNVKKVAAQEVNNGLSEVVKGATSGSKGGKGAQVD